MANTSAAPVASQTGTRNSSCFPLTSAYGINNPVIFPLGCARLATSPSLTALSTKIITMFCPSHPAQLVHRMPEDIMRAAGY